MSSVANTPDPPYYAVIFTNEQNENIKGYSGMSGRMQALASRQPGYLGFESARDGLGITVSYWDSLEAIALVCYQERYGNAAFPPATRPQRPTHVEHRHAI